MILKATSEQMEWLSVRLPSHVEWQVWRLNHGWRLWGRYRVEQDAEVTLSQLAKDGPVAVVKVEVNGK